MPALPPADAGLSVVRVLRFLETLLHRGGGNAVAATMAKAIAFATAQR